jgi:hypothetical protein
VVRRIPPFLDLVGAEHQQIDRYAEAPQRPSENGSSSTTIRSRSESGLWSPRAREPNRTMRRGRTASTVAPPLGSLNNPYVSMERFRPKWVEKSGVKREDPSTWGIGAGGHDGWTAFSCVKS